MGSLRHTFAVLALAACLGLAAAAAQVPSCPTLHDLASTNEGRYGWIAYSLDRLGADFPDTPFTFFLPKLSANATRSLLDPQQLPSLTDPELAIYLGRSFLPGIYLPEDLNEGLGQVTSVGNSTWSFGGPLEDGRILASQVLSDPDNPTGMYITPVAFPVQGGVVYYMQYDDEN